MMYQSPLYRIQHLVEACLSLVGPLECQLGVEENAHKVIVVGGSDVEQSLHQRAVIPEAGMQGI